MWYYACDKHINSPTYTVMKAFILRNIWVIRIVWLIGVIALVLLLDSGNKKDSLVLIMYIMAGGSFVWFPRGFLGKEKESQQTVEDSHAISTEPTTGSPTFPIANNGHILLQHKMFQSLRSIDSEYLKAKKVRDESLSKVFDDFFQKLHMQTPEHLREKVENNFTFSLFDEDKTKHNLAQLYLNHYKKSLFTEILIGISLTEEELCELNYAWYPFISIHPKDRRIKIRDVGDMIQEDHRTSDSFLQG
jgi:hypothetical protein